MTDPQSTHLQRCLERLQQGDRAAGGELLRHTCDRLARLTHLMLKDYARLKRWEETDDVLQGALLRLWRALEQVTPASLRDYYRLATLQIRRELIDLSRHHYGPQGQAARHATNAAWDGPSASAAPLYEQASRTLESSQLALWSEFHQQAEKLPEEEGEVFDLVYYQGVSQVEAAALLNVSARTVKRRYQAACLKVHEALGGALPGM
jgi:RNA polymerase sigma-70 factor (ECF subfamily)